MGWPLARRVFSHAFLYTALLAGAVGDQNSALSYLYTQTARYDAKAWVAGRDRFPAGAKLIVVSGGTHRPLVADFFASADASVSFDGTHVLFAGKRAAADHWQVWEITIGGGEPKRLTTFAADCLHPLYLPDGRIVYTRMTRAGSYLEATATKGTAPTRLTYGPARVLADDVLRDGRILFESAASATAPRELFTVYPDGTGVEAMRCDHGADRGEARQVSSGEVVFRAGERLARFTPALAKQTAVSNFDRDAVGPVAEVSADSWIIAMRSGSGRYGLVQWNAAGGHVKQLEAPADSQALQPVIVGSRVPPRRFPSALVPTRTAGNLLCLDARVTRPALDADIRAVRFFTQNAAGTSVPLGETTVEKDGSFYVQLPADQPVRMELLDASGKMLRGEHGWFWMRPSEQRVCVGCHAGPERAPENKVPAVLLRTTTPAKLMGASGQGK